MKKSTLIKFIFLVSFIGFWSFFLFFYGANQIVAFVGSDNALVVAFIIAALGGVSTITATTFYTTIITLAQGGVNPLALGIVAGIGITLGDSLFYYLGRTGKQTLSGKPKKWSDEFKEWLNERPKWLVPVITFVYVGLTPFPNDILTISLGISKTPYLRIVVPLLLGNILLTTIVALTLGSTTFF